MARTGAHAAAQNPPSSRAPNVASMRDVISIPLVGGRKWVPGVNGVEDRSEG